MNAVQTTSQPATITCWECGMHADQHPQHPDATVRGVMNCKFHVYDYDNPDGTAGSCFCPPAPDRQTTK